MPTHRKKDSGKKDSGRNDGNHGGSQRQLRVSELVRHAISEILSQGGIHDDTLSGHIITVPEVRMSPDLKLPTVSIMPRGGPDVATVGAAR